ASDFEPRTLQYIPSQHASDDDLEIPTAHGLMPLAFKIDEFRAAGFVTLGNDDVIETRADIRARVALQRLQQISPRDHVGPGGVRTCNAEFVAHAAQIRSRIRAPEPSDV